MDSVYTAEQAARGAEVFETVCMRCHSSDHFTPDGMHSITEKFATVGELFARMSSRMPLDDPGSLTPAQYIDATSYILDLNRYPSGAKELPTDTAALARIRIVPFSAASAPYREGRTSDVIDAR